VLSSGVEPAVIAHRGASAYAPGNSLAAFELALRLGADAIELDLRATADGELVVLHDATLERTAGDPRFIAETPHAELSGLAEPVRPPRLADVFDAFGATTHYLLDVKAAPGSAQRRLADTIGAAGLRERVVVQSFDHLLLRRLARHGRRLTLAALLEPGAASAPAAAIARFASALAPASHGIDAALVRRAHSYGLAVLAWTVNDEAAMTRLLGLGVDALITDVPDRACAVRATAPLAA
jgi:glycerophosphoryl diester phosphodiesterase